MNQAFDPLNLLILAIAVVVILRLRSVLGKRTGNERPPFDPYAAQRRAEKPQPNGNVINMPQRDNAPDNPVLDKPAEPVWSGYAEADSNVAKGLEKIAAADSQFSTQIFVDGAKVAYEMVVTAFAQGDRQSLKNLLSRDVYEGFAKAIEEREKVGNVLESRFVGIDKTDVVGADMKGKKATITIRFLAEFISATLNKAGEVIEGDPKQVREVTDVWTFERDTGSRDPNWKLAATDETG
ncbi:Tim44 domain-containing protein [Nordella sp. HKS 07]|uniref:Tim44/TimA family putative adaptor protein n=1 Tax=Nordella sp. HKS 07 TaxID=2712222 RepID=UPI0013E1EA37|nr:Tim44/TimA family putative adaptor protein [Nordella sp. HKS 07]QIG52430.1 Tim44 domain-containing protein [Nordella sp. HKS 07]